MNLGPGLCPHKSFGAAVAADVQRLDRPGHPKAWRPGQAIASRRRSWDHSPQPCHFNTRTGRPPQLHGPPAEQGIGKGSRTLSVAGEAEAVSRQFGRISRSIALTKTTASR